MPDPKTFFGIAASVANPAAANPNGLILLANGLRTFFIKGKPGFSNSLRSLPENPLDCPILESWVFDYFILADELFAKALQSPKTCVLVNHNLCRKSVSSIELITFDERFKITSVPCFIPDFSLLS